MNRASAVRRQASGVSHQDLGTSMTLPPVLQEMQEHSPVLLIFLREFG